MFTPKLRYSLLTRSTKETENFKSIFPTVSRKQFFLCHFVLSLDVKKWAQKAMFQVTKLYTERENLVTMRKLDACNFFLLCNDSKQTQWMPASVHATASGNQHSAWVTHALIGFRFYKNWNARLNLWNLEVFYKKTIPVTPIFIPLIFCQSW